ALHHALAEHRLLGGRVVEVGGHRQQVAARLVVGGEQPDDVGGVGEAVAAVVVAGAGQLHHVHVGQRLGDEARGDAGGGGAPGDGERGGVADDAVQVVRREARHGLLPLADGGVGVR